LELNFTAEEEALRDDVQRFLRERLFVLVYLMICAIGLQARTRY
jgi:hypothetical protein